MMTEIEPNNSFSDPTVISLGTTWSGDLSSSRDVDIFEMNIPGAGKTDFQFSGTTGYTGDFKVVFYKSNQFQDQILRSNSISISTQSAEKYYIKISSGDAAIWWSGKEAKYDFISEYKPSSYGVLATGWDGSQSKESVNEGDYIWFTLYTKNIPNGTSIPWSISGVSQEDILYEGTSGYFTVGDNSGYFGTKLDGSNGFATKAIFLSADKKTEGNEILIFSAGGQKISIPVNDTSRGLPPTYLLSSIAGKVEEGSIVNIQLSTSNLPAGYLVPYTIDGIDSEDIENGYLAGNFEIGVDGKSLISIKLKEDRKTEGLETLRLTSGGKVISVAVSDTSKQEPVPTYSISSLRAAINEGGSADFQVTTTNVAPYTLITYTITGVDKTDILGNVLTGTTVVGSDGKAIINVPVKADRTTEGEENLTVTVQNVSASSIIKDTSSGYVGEFKDDRFNGQGTYTFASGDKYVGEFKDDKRDGQGTLTFARGDKYVGEFKDDKYNGQGTFTFASGDKYVGEFKDDKRDGQGTFTFADGRVWSGIWIDDSLAASVYSLKSKTNSVIEGLAANFELVVTNYKSGSSLSYRISGVGVSSADVVGGKLTGTVEVGEDGTAAITIPTAIDALTEGTETLTLTINGQKASVALLDDNLVRVRKTVLEGGAISLYKASLGGFVLATPGLEAGDALDDYVPLKASAIKDYALPKGLSAVLGYEDGSFGLIIKTVAGSTANFREKKFSEDGIAEGKAVKLSAAQVLAKEIATDTDINDDGVIGEVIVEVYDGDGDANQTAYGLYKTSTGAVVLGEGLQLEGFTVAGGVTLLASKTKSWVVPSGSSVAGAAITDGGSLEVLTFKGNVFSVQKFDPETGLIKGELTTLNPLQLTLREYYYALDFTGDDDIRLVGYETMPVGWTI